MRLLQPVDHLDKASDNLRGEVRLRSGRRFRGRSRTGWRRRSARGLAANRLHAFAESVDARRELVEPGRNPGEGVVTSAEKGALPGAAVAAVAEGDAEAVAAVGPADCGRAPGVSAAGWHPQAVPCVVQ